MRKQKTVIQKVEPEQADAIIDTRRPLGLFYVPLASIYLGIDNSNGNACTEAFSRLGNASVGLTIQISI